MSDLLGYMNFSFDVMIFFILTRAKKILFSKCVVNEITVHIT